MVADPGLGQNASISGYGDTKQSDFPQIDAKGARHKTKSAPHVGTTGVCAFVLALETAGRKHGTDM